MTTTVTILGSGTCVPSTTRSSCAALVETDTCRILLDCGPGTMRRLAEAGRSIGEIDVMLLSHFHPDHTGELAAFLFASKYPPNRRRRKMLTLEGGPGFFDFFDRLRNLYGDWIHLDPERITLVEPTAGEERMLAPGVTLCCAPMRHNPESIAFRIGTGSGSVIYSGDTDTTDELVRLSRDGAMLICESAMPDDGKVPGHLTPSEAGRIAAGAGVDLLVLTHFYPECDAVDIAAQCRRSWSGPLVLATDLLRLVVGDRAAQPGKELK